MFTWKEQFSTGVPIIDEQHQRLFEIGRQVHQLLTERRGDDKYDDLMAVINELHSYTIYHFEFEEGMMEAAGYPRLEAHEREHRKFVEKLEALTKQDLETFQTKVAFEMLSFLSDWIEKHILDTDMDYQTYV